jgi:predicted tellurium resistance membrane protein TerC
VTTFWYYLVYVVILDYPGFNIDSTIFLTAILVTGLVLSILGIFFALRVHEISKRWMKITLTVIGILCIGAVLLSYGTFVLFRVGWNEHCTSRPVQLNSPFNDCGGDM